MSVMHKLFYTCEEASKHIVRKADGESTWLERIQIWIHVQMCDLCKMFESQNREMNKMTEAAPEQNIVATPETKSHWKSKIKSEHSSTPNVSPEK